MDHYFCFRRDLLFHVFLETTQHKGLKHSVESFKLNFVELSLVETRCFNVFTEPLLELLVVIEKFGHNKMQKGPQLSHTVLNRRARQQQTISRLELQQDFPSA